MSQFASDEPAVRQREAIEFWQLLPLLLAALLLTIGLSMFLSGTEKLIDVVQPVIVVFGGTLVALLVTFPLAQIAQALQVALDRGVRGGTDPREMIRAMLKICDISRRDGLLGVAEIRSNSEELEEICHLIGDAAPDSVIRFNLDRRQTSEQTYYRLTADVFLFAAFFATTIGLLGSLIRLVAAENMHFNGPAVMPFVCGVCLAILIGILLARLRNAHLRELVVVEIAYRGASIILEDNNLQRLRSRLTLLVPPGMH